MSKELPKVIQLIANKDGGLTYALDSEGGVWRNALSNGSWRSVKGPSGAIELNYYQAALDASPKARVQEIPQPTIPEDLEQQERGESLGLGDTPWEQL